MTIAPSLSVADRMALTLDGLGRAVAGRVLEAVMTAAMIVLVWQRVRRVERQMRGMLARFRTGRLRVVASPRVGGRGGCAGARGGRLPLRFGWLLPLVPGEAACFAGQLQAVLAEPEMVALMAAAPQARRVMRPVLRMLGIAVVVLPGGVARPAEAGCASAPRAAGRVRRGVGGGGVVFGRVGRGRRRMRIGSFDVMLE